MKSISDYLDAARAKSGIPSDSQLAARLGVAQTQVVKYRRAHGFPSDATMLRIADLAHIDGVTALLHLNILRTDKVCRPLYAAALDEHRHKIRQEENHAARTPAE